MPLDYVMTYWFDHDIRFDLLTRYLKPYCSGEKIIEVMEPVEDTKGNNGEPGKLVVTNLRLIWQSKKFPKINLSIGFNPITSITVKIATSKLRGLTESLHILARTKNSRYEFIFTNLVQEHNRLFALVIGVHRAYAQSRLYREIKMRSATVVCNKKLQMLQQEEIVEQINGVWNLSSDQGNLGSFFITNVRVVWYAASNELFNASIPFLQISEKCFLVAFNHIVSISMGCVVLFFDTPGKIKIRDSKFGKALVIETAETGGSYVLGFRIDPKEKLYGVHKTLLSIHETFNQYPVFGVDFNPDTIEQETELEKQHRFSTAIADEVDEIEDNPEMASDAFAAYFADGVGDGGETREIVYSPELGLAVEKPKDGFTLQSLWEVIPST